MKNRIIISIVVFLAFGYGLLVGHKKIFPFEQAKYVYHLVQGNNESIEVWKGKQGLIDPIHNPSLPNVLIIGDSISMGYTYDVRKKLEDKANVYRIPENGRDTIYGKRMIQTWTSVRKWDVIHFNWGLWDTLHRMPVGGDKKGKIFSTHEEYKENLEKLIPFMKATKAKLIWCNTTPIPDGKINWDKGDSFKYNKIAKKIMEDNGIQINDLYSYAIKNIENIQISKDVHFTSDGSEYLADKVSVEILKALK